MVTKQERAKDLRLQREFHITLEEFNRVLKFQGGACAICKNKLNKKGFPFRLAVDHCHTTGLCRGLLCWPCNKAIAILQDDAQRMYNAYMYLSNPPFTQVLGQERFTAPGRVGTKVREKLLVKFNAARGEVEEKQKGRASRKVQSRIR